MPCDFDEDAADNMRDRTRAPKWWPPDQRSCEDDDGDAVAPIVTSVFTQDVPINLFLPNGTLFIGNALALLIGAAVRMLSLYGGLVLWRSRGRMETTHVLIGTAESAAGMPAGTVLRLEWDSSPAWKLLGVHPLGLEPRTH